jgi:hypothetical protein
MINEPLGDALLLLFRREGAAAKFFVLVILRGQTGRPASSREIVAFSSENLPAAARAPDRVADLPIHLDMCVRSDGPCASAREGEKRRREAGAGRATRCRIPKESERAGGARHEKERVFSSLCLFFSLHHYDRPKEMLFVSPKDLKIQEEQKSTDQMRIHSAPATARV